VHLGAVGLGSQGSTKAARHRENLSVISSNMQFLTLNQYIITHFYHRRLVTFIKKFCLKASGADL